MKLNKLALKELQKRQIKSLPNFFDGKFKVQEDFIMHPSRMKALFCTRRFGKSYTGGLYLVKEAYENPGITCVYIALTRESAKKIMYKDVLKPLNKRFKLNAKFNETTLTISLPNGSIIYLVGTDSNEEEKDKLLGQKYKLAIIDECASFSINLHELVYGTLKPAMADLNGTIVMLGTPGNLTKSLFYDVTTGKEPGWHVVKGTTNDNPYMAQKWRKEIAELTERQPYIVETPMFKQMYLGEWVVDDSALVYKYNVERNHYTELPKPLNGQFQYMLGVDLGYEDDSAFVVVAYHEHLKQLYEVFTYKQSKLDITAVAHKIKELQSLYQVSKIVIDGANKQAVEEIQRRHSIPLITADKRGKQDFIEIMNGELIQGNIKVTSHALIEEWQGLVWKEKNGNREENPLCPNHASDAMLYIWRYTYAYLGQPLVPKLKPYSQEWFDAETARLEEEATDFFTKNAQKTDDYGDF